MYDSNPHSKTENINNSVIQQKEEKKYNFNINEKVSQMGLKKNKEPNTIELSENLTMSSMVNHSNQKSQNLCMNCNYSDDLKKLECNHYLCIQCLKNLLTIKTEKEKQFIVLRCMECARVIYPNILKKDVPENTLVKYLQKISIKKNRKNLFIQKITTEKCEECGETHGDGQTCIEYYENVSKIILSCSHLFCVQCLLSYVRKNLEENPFLTINCPQCAEGIPLETLYSLFGGQENYIRCLNACLDSTILAPKLTCIICTEQLPSNCFVTLSCDDRFCKTCIKDFIECKINSFEVNPEDLLCPLCNQPIQDTYEIIKANASEEYFNKYIHFTMKKYKTDEEDDVVMK